MGRGPSSGVAFPSLIAIEWVGDPFPCVTLAWPVALQLCALFGRWTFLPCSVGGSRTCKCSEGEGLGPLPLFACIGQRSKCGVYLLSSGLSAAVKLFTNCKGTTLPYFFITLSIYVFITLEISCTFMLLYQLNSIISYTSIVLLHS